jgi:hypothetical protein
MSLTDIIKKHENLIVAETLLVLSKVADVGSTLLCVGVHGAAVEFNDLSHYLMTQTGPEGFATAQLAFVGLCAYRLRNSSKGLIYSLTAVQLGLSLNNLYAYYFC